MYHWVLLGFIFCRRISPGCCHPIRREALAILTRIVAGIADHGRLQRVFPDGITDAGYSRLRYGVRQCSAAFRHLVATPRKPGANSAAFLPVSLIPKSAAAAAHSNTLSRGRRCYFVRIARFQRSFVSCGTEPLEASSACSGNLRATSRI